MCVCVCVFTRSCVGFLCAAPLVALVTPIVSGLQTANGNVEAKVVCFYRRRDISSTLIALADKHASEWPTVTQPAGINVSKNAFLCLTPFLFFSSLVRHNTPALGCAGFKSKGFFYLIQTAALFLEETVNVQLFICRSCYQMHIQLYPE